jgi:acyl-CoA synthetase (AMP-forming)/AMP-acid ligase II
VTVTSTQNIPATLESSARWFPDTDFLVQGMGDDDRRYTYAEFREAAHRMADAYGTLGVGAGDRVAFLSDTTVEHAVAYVGAIECGAIATTLHARETPTVLRSLLEELDPAAFVVHPKYTDTVAAFVDQLPADLRVFALEGSTTVPDFAEPISGLLDAGDPGAPAVDIEPSDPALINYTSGSTGSPKGVVHTHGEVVESAHLAHYSYMARRDDIDLNPFAASFIGWPMHVFTFGSIGATVVLLEEWTPEPVPDLIEEAGVTYVILTPTQWRQLLEAGLDEANTSTLDRVGYAGEPISESLFRRLRSDVCEQVLSIYGGTEIMNAGTVLFPDEVTPETLASIGRPAPNVDVRIVAPGESDPSLERDPGEVGEIIVRGPAVAETVWRDEETTDTLFHEDGWWFSGDLGQVRENGHLYVEGRVDNMIISGGMNVYAEVVEGILESHPDVLAVAVVGTDHEEWGTAVKAVVRPAREDLTAEDLDAWCRDHEALADYQRPREYAVPEDLPRTATGKIDREALRE